MGSALCHKFVYQTKYFGIGSLHFDCMNQTRYLCGIGSLYLKSCIKADAYIGSALRHMKSQPQSRCLYWMGTHNLEA